MSLITIIIHTISYIYIRERETIATQSRFSQSLAIRTEEQCDTYSTYRNILKSNTKKKLCHSLYFSTHNSSVRDVLYIVDIRIEFGDYILEDL